MKPADIALLIAKAEPKLEEIYPDSPQSGRGRRATIRSMAVTQVAQQIGMTEAAVWKALQRSKKSTPKPKPLNSGEHRFEFLGVDVTPAFRAQLSAIVTAMKAMSRQLSAAKTSLTTLAVKHGIPAPYLKVWLEEFDALANRTRSLQPVGICPWCKNTATYRKGCVACYGSGWLIRAKAHAVPERLKQPNVVIQNGDEKRVNPDKQAADPVTQDSNPWDE